MSQGNKDSSTTFAARSKWRRGAEPQDQPRANGEIEGAVGSGEKEMTMEKERRDQVEAKAELMGHRRRVAIAREERGSRRRVA